MKKVLIIKLSAIGDIFLTLPHMAAICHHYKGEDVRLMTGPSFVPLFEHHPNLRTVPLDRRQFFFGQSALARTLWTRRQRFDVVYDLQGNRTSRRLVRFSQAPLRVGPQPHRVYTHHPATRFEDNPGQSVFERFNDTIVAGGLPKAEPRCTLYLSPEEQSQVAVWKSAHDLIDGRYVLFHAGSSSDWPSKRWPERYFLQLAGHFQGEGLQCVWIGGPEDTGINRRLADMVGIDATGQFSFLQIHQLAKDALFAVTNDSGPMHIIATSGIPVFSFFGPTSWERSHAASQRSRVITTPTPCSPCFKGNCPPDKGHACLETIAPEQVIAKIEQELDL